VFDAITTKFRDVTFEKVNLDENKDLASKYSVQSIPRMIMLDASGNAIYNASPPRSEESLAELIQQHR
jgi:thioredoxin-like negative regulator of GroEL